MPEEILLKAISSNRGIEMISTYLNQSLPLNIF